ncbi:prolyl oligopeptidase family serine peptidase [Nocardiopsis sp. CT-R113]|uniref:Prolyl oligopeptidase family serine peptidase n=1 Tax=Nocardiopsis codii TaxID=3065942 RepID=A0ABU7K544_9ACTN|nr:prolyl oligopeptidase family serine peptidase [Nocardiopsis sp. CT-R113]MEE2037368.1 prolyl oligopeptidase family serine peptidase [Nocardiopsis sp. CT-R113]
MDAITGTAAGVPFTALPPSGTGNDRAPLIVTWHMLDAPRTDAAFAAALPMAGVPSWRVHLGMPLCGTRMVEGRLDRHLELAREDILLAYFGPVVHQAVEEFPAALAELRRQLPIDDQPIGILGASLGGAVALQVLTAPPTPIGAVALVNPAVRVSAGVELLAAGLGQPYGWTAESRRAADDLDFVGRAGELSGEPPLLLVSGEHDHPALREDAFSLVKALRGRYARPDEIELTTVPGLAHPLADEPGLEPAPQLPATVAVDEVLTQWFVRRFATR